MEDKKILEIVNVYRSYFKVKSIPSERYPHDKLIHPDNADEIRGGLAHCHSILNGVEEFIAEGGQGDDDKRDRALMRLGFVQGCLRTSGHYTVDDFKVQTKPNTNPADANRATEPLTREDLDDWEY